MPTLKNRSFVEPVLLTARKNLGSHRFQAHTPQKFAMSTLEYLFGFLLLNSNEFPIQKNRVRQEELMLASDFIR